MHDLLLRQLAADFCVSAAEVLDPHHHFTVFEPRPDRRKYLEVAPCILKIAVVRGKLLRTAHGVLGLLNFAVKFSSVKIEGTADCFESHFAAVFFRDTVYQEL